MSVRRHIYARLQREEFVRYVSRKPSGDLGVFLPILPPVAAGHEVEVDLAFEGHPHHFYFQGVVISVRSQEGGEALPAGVEVAVKGRHRNSVRQAVGFSAGDEVEWHARDTRRWPAVLELQVSQGARVYGGATRDISLTGAFVTGMEPLPAVGEELELRFLKCGRVFPLKIRARVMRQDFFKNTRGVGVRFLGGGFRWKQRLVELVDGLSTSEAR